MSAAEDTVAHFPGVEAFARQAPQFVGQWAHQLPVEPAEYLVEGLIPRRAYSLVYARRGGGKSFFITDLAFKGALGSPFLGHEIHERFGSVVFVGEKKARFGKRPRAWLQANDLEGVLVPVLIVEGVPNLLDPESVDACIDYLNGTARPMLEKAGVPLEAVFFDTLARCLPGGSVSDQQHANTAIPEIQRIVDEARVAVIPTAHVAKAATNQDATAKGAGEWEDAADAVIRIEREGQAELRTVTNTKQSDGPEAPAAAFTLRVVTLGTTKHGRDIASCVIEEADVPEDEAPKRRVPTLNADALTVLQAFDRMLAEGQTVPAPDVPGAPQGAQAVLMRFLRVKAYDLGLRAQEAPDGASDPKELERWEEKRKKAFSRGVDDLVKYRKLRREGSHLWAL